MLGFECCLPVDADMLEYLQYESVRRNISIEDAYREEVDGQERARCNMPTREQLEAIAKNCTPDPRYLTEDEECPF